MLGKSFILAGLMLMTTTPALAANTSTATASYTPEIEETAPLKDLLENTRFKAQYSLGYYAKSASTDPNNPEGIYPIQLLEWHYGYSDYGLYFYVWNQTQYEGFDLFSSLNGITLQDLDTGSYYMYPIRYISKTNEQFYKFKIDLLDLSLFDYLTEDGNRSYSVGQLHLKKKVSQTGLATAYTFGKKYIYSGSLNADNLEMQQKDIDILTVDVGKGVYQSQASELDVFRHTDLHYVYFNVPNEYISTYGEVAEYHFSYYPVSLAPIAAIQGTALNQTAINSASNPHSFNQVNGKDNYTARYQWYTENDANYYRDSQHEYGFVCEYLDEGSLGASGVLAGKTLTIASAMVSIGLTPITFGISLLGLMGTTGMAAYTEAIKAQQWGYLRDLYFENGHNYIPIADAYDDVSSSKIDEYINLDNLELWSAYQYSEQAKALYPTFSDFFNASHVEEHLRYDAANYELSTFKADRYSFSKDGITLSDEESAWDAFKQGSISIAPIEKITSSNASTDVETWKLETGTGDAFHNNFVSASNTNKTPYIFRFAPTPSITYPLFYSSAKTNGALELAVDSCNRAGSVYIGYGIYDLVSLDLTFEKNGVETIMPICADPLNINPAIDHAEATEGEEQIDIWAIVKKILVAAAIFIGIVFALWLLLKIIGWTRKAFKD